MVSGGDCTGSITSVPVTVSAGICAFPEHAGSVTELLTGAAVVVLALSVLATALAVRDRALVETAYAAGLRISELAAAGFPESAPAARMNVVAVRNLLFEWTVPKIPIEAFRQRLGRGVFAPGSGEVVAAINAAGPDVSFDGLAELVGAEGLGEGGLPGATEGVDGGTFEERDADIYRQWSRAT